MEVLAQRVIDLRTERGISSERLAGKLGVSHRTVINWEKDRRDPNLANLVALAELFDVSPDYLIGWDQRDHLTRNK